MAENETENHGVRERDGVSSERVEMFLDGEPKDCIVVRATEFGAMNEVACTVLRIIRDRARGIYRDHIPAGGAMLRLVEKATDGVFPDEEERKRFLVALLGAVDPYDSAYMDYLLMGDYATTEEYPTLWLEALPRVLSFYSSYAGLGQAGEDIAKRIMSRPVLGRASLDDILFLHHVVFAWTFPTQSAALTYSWEPSDEIDWGHEHDGDVIDQHLYALQLLVRNGILAPEEAAFLAQTPGYTVLVEDDQYELISASEYDEDTWRTVPASQSPVDWNSVPPLDEYPDKDLGDWLTITEE